MSTNRRKFLGGSAAAMTGPAALYVISGTARSKDPLDTFCGHNSQEIRQLGTAAIAGADKTFQRQAADLASKGRQNLETQHNHLSANTRRIEFEQESVILVNGSLLSRSEAMIYAAFSLLDHERR